MFRAILVPMDGSATAEGILPHVRALAQDHGTKLIFLRVAFALAFPGADPTEAQIQKVGEAQEYIEKIRRTFQAEGMEAKAAVRYGFPAEEILAHARREKVDLIAMATHGRSGPARWMLGSVAEEVLRKADVPVLLFRVGRDPAQKARAGISSKPEEGRIAQ